MDRWFHRLPNLRLAVPFEKLRSAMTCLSMECTSFPWPGEPTESNSDAHYRQ